MGPIFGGILTSVWNWRAIFWFLTILSATSVLCFIFFFKDTYRPERSLTYQRVAKEKMRSTASLPLSYPSRPPTLNINSTLTLGVSADIERGAAYVTREKESAVPAIKLSITDINPFRPIGQVLRRPNNVLILLSSGEINLFWDRPDTDSLQAFSMRLALWCYLPRLGRLQTVTDIRL